MFIISVVSLGIINLVKKCLKEFGELGISPYSQKIDNRFKLLQQAANIYCDVDVNEKIIYQTENGKAKYYNLEYLFCIILDVIFTSLFYNVLIELSYHSKYFKYFI